MTEHKYYSLRTGTNPNKDGFAFDVIKELFQQSYLTLRKEGYFDESFGFWCDVDEINILGKVVDVNLEIVLNIRKKHLWPIEEFINTYNEDDFFDIIEFLYTHVSKPIDGSSHGWNNFCRHWETFNKAMGRKSSEKKLIKFLKCIYVDMSSVKKAKS